MRIHGMYNYVSGCEVDNLGGFHRVTAYSAPGGDLYKWVAGQKLIHVAGDSMMVHAGFDISLVGTPIDTINENIKDMMQNPMHWMLHEGGLLWTRSYDTSKEADICPQVDYVLAHYGVSRLIVGHTPQKNGRITSRCGGRVMLADVDIYEGNISWIDLEKEASGRWEAYTGGQHGRTHIPLSTQDVKKTSLATHLSYRLIICSAIALAAISSAFLLRWNRDLTPQSDPVPEHMESSNDGFNVGIKLTEVSSSIER